MIRQARTSAGWTQARLAEAGKTTQSAIARWERGATEPAFATVVKLVEACGFGVNLQLKPGAKSGIEVAKPTRIASTSGSQPSAATNGKKPAAGAKATSTGTAAADTDGTRPDLPSIPGLDLISDVLDLFRPRGRRK